LYPLGKFLLSGSFRHFDHVSELEAQGIGFASLSESIDTSSANGRFIFSIFGSLAEFERNLIRERTQAGLTAARARGRVGGRPAKLQGKDLAMAKSLMADKSNDVTAIAIQFGVSRTTLSRVVNAEARG
jgi:DNA invertase Pin-like site-specific DNA recombinase